MEELSLHVQIGHALLERGIPSDLKGFRGLFREEAHKHSFFHGTNPEGYNTLLHETRAYLVGVFARKSRPRARRLTLEEEIRRILAANGPDWVPWIETSHPEHGHPD